MATTDNWTIPGWSATSLARKVAGRGDATVVIDADPASPALVVDVDTGEIRVGVGRARLDAGDAIGMLDTLAQRLQHPVLAGLVLDGASRAAHSRWHGRLPESVAPDVVAAAWALDAARAHRRLIARSPQSRMFLRASTPVLFSGEEIRVRRAVEDLLPRVDAGVLPRWVGTQLREAVEVELGPGVLGPFEAIYRQVLDLKDADQEALLHLAAEWVQLWNQLDAGGGQDGAAGDGATDDADDAAGASGAGGLGGSAGGDTETESEPAEPQPTEDASDDTRAAGDDADGDAAGGEGQASTSADADSDDAAGDAEGGPAGESENSTQTSAPGPSGGVAFSELITELLDATTAEADAALTAERHRTLTKAPTPEEHEDSTQRALATEIANSVFGPSATRRLSHRSPTADDVAQRAAIVRRLERAQYAAPRVVTEQVGYPAGRPRTGALVQRAAQRAQGQAVTATPWRRQRRRIAEKPPIHAGIVVDYSGSMSAWMPSAGTAMWSLAAAAAELGGTAAAVGFGGTVTALMKSRTRPTLVPAVPNGGSSSGCAEAMAAVSDAAQLMVPFGARVLVVLTDGQLPGRDAAAIEAHTRYLHRHDVTVVWALTGTTEDADVIPKHAVVVDEVTPDSFGALVADTLATALEAAHRQTI
ncbi:hypothetical protein [Prescottella agglutinans]|uniref:Mg-chelatase subunit ChlD n=1 Tax=Prescottella agglutinans TaxID=1644129 RepID=A0ABT6MJ28_9NOCA|nr:hypothetical protein [Prescottella agglutinans]MDH6284328.1 Mg-chelatase subunit ChlD [Prescottella agglutinans]